MKEIGRPIKIENLQALRFVFSFSILVSHLLGHTYSTFGLGEYGVSGFFILSGFVLSIAYSHKVEEKVFHCKSFFFKQWMKLYPLHIVTFIIAIFYEAHYGKYYEWYQLIPPVFLVQSWIPADQFHYIPNGSSWSLCGFFFFYVLFSSAYLLVYNMSQRKLLLTIMIGLIAYFALVVNIPAKLVYPFVYASPLMRLPEFVLGIILFRVLRSKVSLQIRIKLSHCNIWILTLLEIVVLLMPILAFLVYDNTNIALRCVSLFWVFVSAQLLMYTWSDKSQGLVTRIFHSKPIMFLGKISFEIYLLHMFIVPLARSLAFKLGFCPIGLFALALTVAVVVPLSYVAKKYFVDKIYVLLDGHVKNRKIW